METKAPYSIAQKIIQSIDKNGILKYIEENNTEFHTIRKHGKDIEFGSKYLYYGVLEISMMPLVLRILVKRKLYQIAKKIDYRND